MSDATVAIPSYDESSITVLEGLAAKVEARESAKLEALTVLLRRIGVAVGSPTVGD